MKSAIYVINRKDQKRILNADNKILNFIRKSFSFNMLKFIINKNNSAFG